MTVLCTLMKTFFLILGLKSIDLQKLISDRKVMYDHNFSQESNNNWVQKIN